MHVSTTLARALCLGLALAALGSLFGCGDSDGGPAAAASAPTAPALPQLAAATPATFAGDCSTLQPLLTSLAGTTITAATTVAAGTVSGALTAEHCRLVGKMNERVSAVDGNTYAIGFEMRMPKAWNGRFYYQANGGIDGNIGTAAGGIGGGGATATALSKGFAVLSSDAGHSGFTPFFGLDPQARLDYGYNAVGQLTPMAKNLIKAVYGKAPDRSYLGGCSNGGRHAMVAAARYADQYDGIVAGDPGFNLPKAAVAQLWGVQQYATVSTAAVTASFTVGSVTSAVTLPSVTTSFTICELSLVGAKVLEKCDALDGLADGIVGNVKACQAAFNLATAVPTCAGGANARDGFTCLSSNQKSVLANIMAGAKNTAGASLYADWPWDTGLNGANWRVWKFANSTSLDPGAVGFIFTTPPQTNTATFSGLPFAMNFNFDVDAPKIFGTTATYPVAPMTFMTPPDPTNLATLKNRGAKLIVYHGTADPVFSFNDTMNWYEGVRTANGGDASNFARLFPVPGMNHCSGGPATDKFDMVDALVSWVESGTAPASVMASARGAGTNAPNAEIPNYWLPTRTRPLCPWPQVATYAGSGDVDLASNFSCK